MKRSKLRRSSVILVTVVILALVFCGQTATAGVAEVNALCVATSMEDEQPYGEIEPIWCEAQWICAHCLALSPGSEELAESNYACIGPGECPLPEVREAGGKIWLNGLTIMPETVHSVRDALVYLRDYAPPQYQVPADFFQLHDVSFTFGKLPLVAKGTSAGLAFAIAAYAAIIDVPVMPEVGVTGAIDDLGHVLSVGSIAEKIIAADTQGITTVIIPAANEPELALLPPELLGRVRVILVRTIPQALFHALGQAGPDGVLYDQMYQQYMRAIYLQDEGRKASAIELFSQLSAQVPEDYSIRVWLKYLRTGSL